MVTTDKTMKTKRQEYKFLMQFYTQKRGTEDKFLKDIAVDDLKAYFRAKQLRGNKPQTILTTFPKQSMLSLTGVLMKITLNIIQWTR